jgi:phospholipid transport system transporter-binding protein
MTKQSLYLEGELSFDTASKLVSLIERRIKASKDEQLCLNLSKVTLCDSAGLALMLEAKRLAVKSACQLTIESQPKQMKSLAEFCGVSKVLNECANVN